ncbi:MAG: peptidoglycan DD-metalloendopeptidase family protein [Pseudomonadota bacterium]
MKSLVLMVLFLSLPALVAPASGQETAPPPEAVEPVGSQVYKDTQLRLLMDVLDILQEDVDRLEVVKGRLAERHGRLMARVGEVDERIDALTQRVETQRNAARVLVRAAVRLREPSDWQLLVSSGRYHDMLVYKRTIRELLSRIHGRMEEIQRKKARWQHLKRQAEREMAEVRRLEDDAGQALAEVTARLQEKKVELKERERKITAVSSLFMMVALTREVPVDQDGVPSVTDVALEEPPALLAPAAVPLDGEAWAGKEREFTLPLSPGKIHKAFDRQVADGIGTEKMTRGWILTPYVEKGKKDDAINKAEIRAPASGLVAFLGHIPGFGMTLILEHGEDHHTVYGNLYKVMVNKGDQVTEGDVFALIKSLKQGQPPYLYFEVRERRLAVDPRPWFRLRPIKTN